MFNIFNILSIADKELVHSSMIKLLIDEKELNFTKKFLNIVSFSGDSELEVVKKNSVGKSIRLDIVGFDDSKKTTYKFIIENKPHILFRIIMIQNSTWFHDNNNFF